MTQLLSSRKVSAMQMSNTTPNGATVTPVDDYTIWLACAELQNTYGSLANVLENSAAMTILMSSENAVNYMVRSITNTSGKILYEVVNSETAMEALDASSVALTSAFETEEWFEGMMGSSTAIDVLDVTAIKSPTMTSDTTPSGVVSADSYFDANNVPYKAMDSSTSSAWSTSKAPAQTANVWHKYQFNTALSVYRIDIRLVSNFASPATIKCKLQYSTDNTNWYDCTGVIERYIASNNDTLGAEICNISVPMARYYKIQGISNSGSGSLFGIAELIYYGKELA